MCLQMASLPELAYKQEPLPHTVLLNSLFLKAFHPYHHTLFLKPLILLTSSEFKGLINTSCTVTIFRLQSHFLN